MSQPLIVDSEVTVVAGGRFDFDNVLTKDGGVYDLTDKTVRLTIRSEDAPASIVDATLEDMVVTVDDPTAGGVAIQVTSVMSNKLALTTQYPVITTVPYLAQYKVIEDECYPQLLRFHARRPLD